MKILAIVLTLFLGCFVLLGVCIVAIVDPPPPATVVVKTIH